MNEDEMRELVLRAITDVAPDLDAAAIRPGDRLRADLELDSMDFLDVVARLAEATGVEIPEDDYTQIATVESATAYLLRELASTA